MAENTITQSGSDGNNVIVQNGGTATTNQGNHASNIHEQETDASNKSNTQSNRSEIHLAEVYTSLFAEDNKLKREKIVIRSQEHNRIEGYVELSEPDGHGHMKNRLTYSLSGLYTNKILTAEYISTDNTNDERGVISLKLVGPKLLSGFCSFSKLSSSADDEIRVSPYVWVEGENADLFDGTYDFCTQCFNEKKVCCCATDDIDMPVFWETEADAIRRSIQSKKARSLESFSQSLPSPFDRAKVRQMLRDESTKSDGTLEFSKCHFFNMQTNECKIYSHRPIDCRLFPFDIKLSQDNGEYVIGYYTNLCERELPNFASMKRCTHILRPYFFILYPYLHIYTSDMVCKRLQKAEFQEIGMFKDFIF